MLSEEARRLLTASVDGEVSPRQRRQLDRLLRESAEARDLLELLQRDSGELQALPRQKLPQGFSRQVLDTIAAKKLKPARKPPAPRPFPAWIGVSAAAAVLLAVTAASFFFFASRNRPADQPSNPPLVARQPLLSLPNLDLDPAAARTLGETLAELDRDEAPRLRLACQDPARAVGRMETALKESGIRLMVAEPAKDALRNSARVSYLLFAENMTAPEVVALLQKMGQDDRQSRDGGGPSAGFGRVVVQQGTPEDRKELALLLGVEADALRRTIDLKKPLHSEKGQLAVKGKGKVMPFASKNKKTPERPAERLAVVLTTAGLPGDMAASPEVREFLRRRGPLRPGTLQVIVEIQPVDRPGAAG